jgi:hypothetical protein
MQDRRNTLFPGGCRQFWTVDTRSLTVTVFAPDGATKTYTGTDSIALEPYSSEPLPLARIFAGID